MLAAWHRMWWSVKISFTGGPKPDRKKIFPLLGGATEEAPSSHWLGLRGVGTLAMDRIPQLDEDSIPISAHGLGNQVQKGVTLVL